MRYIALICLWFASAFLSPAQALDPLRVDNQLSLIHMAEFVRKISQRSTFAIQNASDEEVVLELQRYPSVWPLASFLNIEVRPIKPLRLQSSDGQEFAADWRQPNLVGFNVPAQTVRTFTIHGYPGPQRHLWLWGDGAREKFERDARYIWALLIGFFAVLMGFAFFRRLLVGFDYAALILLEAAALFVVICIMRANFIAPRFWAVTNTDTNLLIALFLFGAATFVAHVQFPSQGHVLRGYWGLVRGVVDFVVVVTLSGWGYAMLVGPFWGYLTLDLMPLGLFLAGLLLSLGVLLAPALPAQMVSADP